jgi:hypothetical protein
MTFALVFLIVVALGCWGWIWLEKRGERARFTPPWTLPPNWYPPASKEKTCQLMAEQWNRWNQEAEVPEEKDPIIILYTEYAESVKLDGPTPPCPICGRWPVDIHTRGVFGHEEDYDLCTFCATRILRGADESQKGSFLR